MRHKLACLCALLLTLWALADGPTWGPEPRNTAVKHGPVPTGAVAAPSAYPSPVAAGMTDAIATDGRGNQWVRLRDTVSATIAAGGAAINVTLPAASPLPISLPASSPVVVVGPLPAGSPVGTLASLPVTPTALASKVYLSGSASSATDIIASTEVAGYASALVQMTGTWSATVKPQTSNDGSTWVDLQVVNGGGGTQNTLYSYISSNGVSAVPLDGRYFRLTCSSYSSGTMVANVTLNPWQSSVYVRQGVPPIGLAAHDAAVSGAPVVFAARAQDTLPSAVSTDADACYITSTKQGQLRVVNDCSANATGYSNYCDPAHAGGSSEVTVKASSAGLVKYIHVSNPNTTDVFLLLWDATNPTPGTTSPLASYCVPGGAGSSNRGVYDLVFGEPGLQFSTALTATVVTTANGSTAPGSAVDLNIGYK